MLNEKSTVKEMREFAGKIGREIPKDKKSQKEIFKFLTKPPKDPAAEALAKQQAKAQEERELKVKTEEAKVKKACKKPLNEKEKAYLAELEVMARSGKQPNTDQMKDLAVLRRRQAITKLSVVEQNEMAALEIKRQAPDAVQVPSSGVTEEERFQGLEARKDIE
jgi:hypothetical protein